MTRETEFAFSGFETLSYGLSTVKQDFYLTLNRGDRIDRIAMLIYRHPY